MTTAGLFSRRRFLSHAAASALVPHSLRLLYGQAGEPVLVRTRDGSLRGLSQAGVKEFRGIPFAEPPVGPLRFQPPVRKAPWSGVRDATSFGASPMQENEPGVEHSEDCLYLNVWAPEGKGPFPVFVWIHGGGFTGGHAFEPVYDGSEFAREGIVCVTVAYRLGVLGFLDVSPLLGIEFTGSANNALRDLIASLEWIKENIGAFGGDPGRVTIGGESAGAKLTDMLMGIPSAQGLFHQMISESGGAERIWSAEAAVGVGKGFGETWKSVAGLDPKVVRSVAATELIPVQKKFIDTWPAHFPLRAELDARLIPRPPIETIGSGSTKGKRLLIGTNRDESALFAGPHPKHDATAEDLGNMGVPTFAEIFEHYKAVYPEMTDEQRRIRALTAEEYWIPSLRVADAHVRAGGQAYMYQLTFAETSGRLSGYAYHSLDVGLVWDKPHSKVDNAAAEAGLAKQMHAAWAAFIRGEDPGAPGLPSWPAYEPATRATMLLDAVSRVQQRPQEQEMRLWDHKL